MICWLRRLIDAILDKEVPIDRHFKLEIDVNVTVDPIVVYHQHQCYNAVRLSTTFNGGNMAAPISAPNGATGKTVLSPVPAGAKFVGAPTIVSSDVSILGVVDHGDGTADLTVVGTEGQTCTLTGTDTGNGFNDVQDFTVSAPAETGVALNTTFP